MTKKFTLLLLIASVIAMSSCSKYGMVSLNYPLEPVAYLPENVKTIALANRSLTSNADKTTKILETILTGELEVSDRKASEQCLRGVFERLDGKSEIGCIIPYENKLYGTGTRELPELLDWQLVDEICKTNKTDALLVLETFDSNSDIFSIPNILGANANQDRSFNVLMRWRMYDPSHKEIIDQYECKRELTFHGDGENANVPPKALYNAAYTGGLEYIERFLPGFFMVNRYLYKKGKGADKKEFATAYRYVITDDWEGAADKWDDILKHSDYENKGRACLNMAVYFEQAGDIDGAIQWARKSYRDYNVKKGREYERALLLMSR